MRQSPPPRTYRVKSFGCQMNVYDGERMAELMTAEGMTAAADAADADLVVLNTCHIREKATEKVYSDIGRLRKDAALCDLPPQPRGPRRRGRPRRYGKHRLSLAKRAAQKRGCSPMRWQRPRSR